MTGSSSFLREIQVILRPFTEKTYSFPLNLSFPSPQLTPAPRTSGTTTKNTSSDTNRTLNLYLANFSQSDITQYHPARLNTHSSPTSSATIAPITMPKPCGADRPGICVKFIP